MACLLAQASGGSLRGRSRQPAPGPGSGGGRLIYSLEQFHTNLTLRDRPFLTAIFLASDNDQETREVLENRFGPA